MKPVVLFLKKDPSKSVSLKGVPVFFQRFGNQTKHWGLVGFGMKQSLGRHDIIITRPEESVNQTCVTRFVVTPRCDRKTQLGDIHRFHWRSDKESWTPADSKSHGKSYDGGDVKIFKNQAVIWELRLEEDDATIAKNFLILIKWTPRLLMVGVLKRSSLDPGSLEQVSSMLNSSSQRPYTNSAKVSLHRCLRASSMPKPSGDQIGGKAIFLDVSIITEPVENFDIPVVAYGSKQQEEEDHGTVEADLDGLERDHDFAHQLVHVPDPESIFIDTPD